ncbi:MAG: hypothetical protein P8J20_04720 [Novosphingobium sp.]|nr:hypothetical protein [Novosphingobium sp.]
MQIGIAQGSLQNTASFVLAGAGAVTGASAEQFWLATTGWLGMVVGVTILVANMTWNGKVWWQRSLSHLDQLKALTQELVSAYNIYRSEISISPIHMADQEVITRIRELAAQRLMERYRSTCQSRIVNLLRELEAKGIDISNIIVSAQYPANSLVIEDLTIELGVMVHELEKI